MKRIFILFGTLAACLSVGVFANSLSRQICDAICQRFVNTDTDARGNPISNDIEAQLSGPPVFDAPHLPPPQ
jgi:hypothetical protein